MTVEESTGTELTCRMSLSKLVVKEGENRGYTTASPVPPRLYWFTDRFGSLHSSCHTVSVLYFFFLL